MGTGRAKAPPLVFLCIELNDRYTATSISAAQQLVAPDRLIEDSIVAGFGFAAFRVMGSDTAKPGGG